MIDNDFYTSFDDIEKKYAILFERKTSAIFEQEIVNLYNTGYIDIQKCEADLTGTLFCNIGNYERLVRNNIEKAKEFYNLAISNYKNYKACFCLSQLTTDIEEKIKLLELSIAYGNESSYIYFELARVMIIKNAESGNNDTESVEKQTSLLYLAASKKSPDAFYLLGFIDYHNNNFVSAEKNLNYAIQLFRTTYNETVYNEKIEKCNSLLNTIHNTISMEEYCEKFKCNSKKI